MKALTARMLALALACPGPTAIAFAPVRAQAAVCTASIDNMVFGAVDTLGGGPSDMTASLSIGCESLLGVTVCAGLGAGSGGVASDNVRLMSGPDGASLRYQLYQDAARAVPWGSVENPALGTVPLIVLPAGTRTTARTIYGRVLAAQPTVPTGSYVSSFTGSQTGFYYGEVTLGTCNVVLLGSVLRPGFQASASVAPNCLVEADDLNFGSRGVLSGAVTAASALRVRCTPGTAYSIGLGGTASTEVPSQRVMRSSAGGQVRYELFQDDQYSLAWTGTTRAVGTGNGLTRVLPVYGRVPAQATPPGGRYTDTVVVTVTY